MKFHRGLFGGLIICAFLYACAYIHALGSLRVICVVCVAIILIVVAIYSIAMAVRQVIHREYTHSVICFGGSAVTIGLLIGLFFSFPLITKPSENSLRKAGKNILQQYYLALQLYAYDNNGFFPDGNNEYGLNKLYSNSYLSGPIHSMQDSNSTSINRYLYFGGHRADKNNVSIIMEDRVVNYKDGYRNILYSDGTIIGKQQK